MVEESNRGRDVKLLPLKGMKKRRDSSPLKRCIGDHAELSHHPKVLRMLAKHAESRVLFTDIVLKVNREGKPKERVLMLSGNAIYVLKPETFKCSTRIPLASISKVLLSRCADNFCMIRVKEECQENNDLFFSCTHKVEFVSALTQGAAALLGLSITLEFTNTMHISTT